MARRPTPIVIQEPQRKSDVAQFGQLLGTIGQLGQQFKQRQQRQALEQRAVQETGISAETAKLAGTEALANLLIKKKTRESSAGKFVELAEKLRPQVTQRPAEPTTTGVPQQPTEALTQPIDIGRGVTTEVTPARPLEALGGLAAEGFLTPQRVGTSLERLGLLPAERVDKVDIKQSPVGQDVANTINQRVGANVISAESTIGEVNALFGKIPTSLPSGFQVTVGPNGEVTVTQGDLSKIAPATKTDFEKSLNNSLSTLGLLDDFRGILTPENVGLIADVTRTVEGAIQQGGAIGNFFGRLRGEAEAQLSRDEAGILTDITGKNIFDPNLSAIDFMETALIFRVAKLLDPSGRLSDEDFKQAQKSLGFDRALTGEPQIRQRLDAFEKFLVRDLGRVRGKLNITLDSRFKELTDPSGLNMSKEEAFKILQEERF